MSQPPPVDHRQQQMMGAVEHFKSTPIFIPENATLPIPATFQYIFKSFLFGGGSASVTVAEVAQDFDKWWAAACETPEGKGACQQEVSTAPPRNYYKLVRRGTEIKPELRHFAKQHWRPELLQALVEANDDGICNRRLREGLAIMCFRDGMVPQDDGGGMAMRRCWSFLCNQRQLVTAILNIRVAIQRIENIGSKSMKSSVGRDICLVSFLLRPSLLFLLLRSLIDACTYIIRRAGTRWPGDNE